MFLLPEADPDRLTTTLEQLTGVTPLDGAAVESRAVDHPDHARVAAWLSGEAWEADVALSTQETRGLTNVIGELPGADPGLPPLLLGAHWDSTATSTPGWVEAEDPAPGADDDASGVAAVLEAARLLASWGPGYERTIRFALFDGEERGLLGSEAYVDALLEAGDPVAVALVLDPVGYNPGGESILWISHDDTSTTLADAVVAAAEDRDLTVYAADADAWGGDTRSDHAPFQAAGMPGLHGGSFPQPEAYHTVDDTFDVVDVAYTTEVAALVATWAASEAVPVPEAEPEPRPGGCATVPAGPSLPWIALLYGLARVRPRVPPPS